MTKVLQEISLAQGYHQRNASLLDDGVAREQHIDVDHRNEILRLLLQKAGIDASL